MLRQLQLGSLVVPRSKYLPPILTPLVQATEEGRDLMPVLISIISNLGFDGFMYAVTSFIPKPNNEARMYVFTTLPREWVLRYDERAYVECDPRVLYSFESSLPL